MSSENKVSSLPTAFTESNVSIKPETDSRYINERYPHLPTVPASKHQYFFFYRSDTDYFFSEVMRWSVTYDLFFSPIVAGDFNNLVGTDDLLYILDAADGSVYEVKSGIKGTKKIEDFGVHIYPNGDKSIDWVFEQGKDFLKFLYQEVAMFEKFKAFPLAFKLEFAGGSEIHVGGK